MLDPDTVAELGSALKDRDVSSHSGLSPMDGAAEGTSKATAANTINLVTPVKANGPARPDKRQIEQRIEEDRERHKRAKEGSWAIGDDEADKLWDEASDFGEDDILQAEEETAAMLGVPLEKLEEELVKIPG